MASATRTIRQAAARFSVIATASFLNQEQDSAPASCDESATTEASAVPSGVGHINVSSSPGTPRLVFLGSGSSTGCPRPLCTMVYQSNNHHAKKVMEPYCQVSNAAITGDPRQNPNYRNNPSILVAPGNGKHVLIDAGKTFREGALRWFPSLGVTSLDALLLTHHHMDAAAGLDDIRGFQPWVGLYDESSSESSLPPSPYRAVPMPLYVSQYCLEDLQERFPWLLPKVSVTGESGDAKGSVDENKVEIARHVATFDVHVMKNFEIFNVSGLDVIPLPVMHGEDLESLGFAFTLGSIHVVYLSDISRILPETLDFIRDCLPQTDILVVDALHPSKRNPVHFSLDEAMELMKLIQPTRMTYLVGMNCDSFLSHDEMNQKLRKEYGNVQLAHDGLVIDAA
jgi:phosphoribosyl 1,2-cyclic phosphodiesterase